MIETSGKARLLAGILISAGICAAGVSVYCFTGPAAPTHQVVSVVEKSDSFLIDFNEAGSGLATEAENQFISSDVVTDSFSCDEETVYTDDELCSYGVVTSRVRLYPDSEGEEEQVCSLLAGTVVRVPAKDSVNGRTEVYYGTYCGYVDSDALTSGLSESEAELASSNTAEEEFEDSYGMVYKAQFMYASPDEDSECSGTMDAGIVVQLLTGKNGWYQCYYNGTGFWMKSDYIGDGYSIPEWKAEENRASTRQAVVEEALKYLGCPYVWAASGPSQFDCSGFTMYIMSKFGISLPHLAASQYADYGTQISKDELKPGDLVYFTHNGYSAGHTGIYIGGGEFIHASSGCGYVTISSLESGGYASAYLGAIRVLP